MKLFLFYIQFTIKDKEKTAKLESNITNINRPKSFLHKKKTKII